jgi:hypothetical protein
MCWISVFSLASFSLEPLLSLFSTFITLSCLQGFSGYPSVWVCLRSPCDQVEDMDHRGASQKGPCPLLSSPLRPHEFQYGPLQTMLIWSLDHGSICRLQSHEATSCTSVVSYQMCFLPHRWPQASPTRCFLYLMSWHPWKKDWGRRRAKVWFWAHPGLPAAWEEGSFSLQYICGDRGLCRAQLSLQTQEGLWKSSAPNSPDRGRYFPGITQHISREVNLDLGPLFPSSDPGIMGYGGYVQLDGAEVRGKVIKVEPLPFIPTWAPVPDL